MSSGESKIKKLIQRAKQVDTDAIGVIYQTYVDRIYRYMIYRVGSQSDAEDLAAEVFVNMLEGLPNYTYTGTPFEAWLYRIAAARVTDFYRQRGPTTELSENLMGDDDSPEELILGQQEITELHNALSQLNDNDQTVLILRFVEKKSHQAVAKIMNKPVSAIKNIQYRALGRLAKLLGSEKSVRHYLRGDDV